MEESDKSPNTIKKESTAGGGMSQFDEKRLKESEKKITK